MREDYEEQLSRMFPRGYIIVYVNRDDSMNYAMNNPEMVEQIFDIEAALKEFAEENE